ncbi:unnamed protein product [Urochloa humidicola]
MITRPPSIGVNAPVAERLSDLQTVWTGLEPFYLLDGKLPLFFEELKNDITRATKSDISSPWFPVYIHFHPAFLSSLSRANFICRVHQDYKSLNLVANENYDVVFDSKPPLDDPDWRLRAKDGILSKTVYYHRWRNLTMTEKEKDLADTHVNTMADLLEFYRHSVQHVNQNATISDVDENELFTANKFPIFLPHLIKMLLKRNLLAHELASAWSNYQASKYDRRGPPATEVAGSDSRGSSGKSLS